MPLGWIERLSTRIWSRRLRWPRCFYIGYTSVRIRIILREETFFFSNKLKNFVSRGGERSKDPRSCPTPVLEQSFQRHSRARLVGRLVEEEGTSLPGRDGIVVDVLQICRDGGDYARERDRGSSVQGVALGREYGGDDRAFRRFFAVDFPSQGSSD